MIPMPLDLRRRFYAEEIEATSDLRNAALLEALAAVPRERFLRPGPWVVRGEADVQARTPRWTPDADARHVYHNLAIGLDPARELFNGAPGLLAMVIDRLDPKPGERVVHVGCGTGYYTALMAQCVGSSGTVRAIEVDAGLADEARRNLAAMPWVEVATGDARELHGAADAILINAGATHILDSWLDALEPGGRLAVPLTVAMTATIGKGLMILVTRGAGDRFTARVIGFVAIYTAAGVRDDAAGQQLMAVMQKQPFPPLAQLRRDVHAPSSSCWLHREGCCLSTATDLR